MAVRTLISTDKAPRAIGPYSQAVRHGDMLFVSGMIALDPKTGEMVGDEIEAQAIRVMENLREVMKAAGFGFEHVVKATVFMKNLSEFTVFNTIYARYLGDNLPARETVQAAALPRGARIEISVICAR